MNNNRKKPFDISEWSKKQLTRGNDIFSRSVMGIMSVVMIVFVLSLGGILPPIGQANAEELETSPVITVPENKIEIIEVEETEPETNALEKSPVITVGLMSTALSNAIDTSVQILNMQPHDLMDTYDTDVYVAYQGGLNIRSLPDTEQGEIVGTYAYCDKVHVLKRGNGWLYTDDGNYIYEDSTSTEKPSPLKYAGKFKTTAYCTCAKCCNPKYGGLTAIGKRPIEGRSIAVDPKVIPLHSKVVINGHEYIAEDTGSAVKGKVIDFYIDGHSRARAHGVQYMDVYVYQ